MELVSHLFRSGTDGLNEDIGRHRAREGMKAYLLRDAECESVSHVFPAYSSIRGNFLVALQGELGDAFKHF